MARSLLWGLAAVPSLMACTHVSFGTRLAAAEQRIEALEQRVERLENRNCSIVPLPHRAKDQLEAHLHALQIQRRNRLINVTEQHPDIVELDNQIRILQQQIKIVAACKP
jgi:polyhydroxyalkanoate synthesis regulator phasin